VVLDLALEGGSGLDRSTASGTPTGSRRESIPIYP